MFFFFFFFFFFLPSHNLIYCFARWERERPWVYGTNMPKELLWRLVILRFHLSEDFHHLKSQNHPSSSQVPWEFHATTRRHIWSILQRIRRRKCRHMANFLNCSERAYDSGHGVVSLLLPFLQRAIGIKTEKRKRANALCMLPVDPECSGP